MGMTKKKTQHSSLNLLTTFEANPTSLCNYFWQIVTGEVSALDVLDVVNLYHIPYPLIIAFLSNETTEEV